MTDDNIAELERLVTPDDKDGSETPSGTPANWLGGGGTTDDTAPGTLEDVLAQQPHGGQGMPTPEDMTSTNASNAEARAKAIKDGMDEGTANILYPEFSTPEDMLKIN
jgi:hypothetical protein